MRKFETDIRVIANNIGVSTDTIAWYVKRLYTQSTRDYYSIVKTVNIKPDKKRDNTWLYKGLRTSYSNDSYNINIKPIQKPEQL